MTPLGEETWKFVSGFSWTSPYIPFPFTDFSLYPFIVIKYKHEYNSFSGPMSPSRQSLNLRVALKNPNTKVILN